MESVEPTSIGNELPPFHLEHFPDRLLGQFWMAMRPGVGDALIEQTVGWVEPKAKPINLREKMMGFAKSSTHPMVAREGAAVHRQPPLMAKCSWPSFETAALRPPHDED
jgi:hypothetical protein